MATAITSSLTVNKPSVTISRRNLGKWSFASPVLFQGNSSATLIPAFLAICISCHYFLSALHGTTLSFNQLQAHGNLRFPDASVKLPNFGRPANIPHIKFPAAFISTVRRARREALLRVNGTSRHDTMVEVMNVVMNNIEGYLPLAGIDSAKDR